MERVEKFCYSKKDFKIEWFSGTGPGGQNRNKVQACVRITHLPSGLKATSQTHRSRAANFRDAFQSLGQQIGEWVKTELNKQNPQRVVSDETIRTYHFADNRVLDHASRLQIAASEIEKKFGDMIAARRAALGACR